MHAYRLANRLDVRERRANAAVADELRGEAAKQGLALVGRTAEVVNLVAVALRAGKRAAGDASAQAQRAAGQAKQSGWMDSRSCQWFGATAARTIISIPVEREHAAAAEAGRIGASGTKAEARPTIASARSRRDIVDPEERPRTVGPRSSGCQISMTVNPFTSCKTWRPTN